MDASRSANSIIAIVVIAIIASILIGAISGFVGILDHEVTTSPGQLSNVTEASYIIYKDGDYTCLKNGTSGRIEMRSANASAVFNSALDEDGVTVAVAKGNYNITHYIDMANNTRVVGHDAVLTTINPSLKFFNIIGYCDVADSGQAATPTYGTNIIATDSSTVAVGDVVYLRSDDLFVAWVAYAYMASQHVVTRIIDANTIEVSDTIFLRYATNTRLIPVDPIRSVTIEGLTIEGVGPYEDSDGNYGIQTNFVSGLSIKDVTIHDCAIAGISIMDTRDAIVSGCHIDGSHRLGLGYGVNVGNSARDVIIESSIIENCRHATSNGGNNAGIPAYITYSHCTIRNTEAERQHSNGYAIGYDACTFDNVGRVVIEVANSYLSNSFFTGFRYGTPGDPAYNTVDATTDIIAVGHTQAYANNFKLVNNIIDYTAYGLSGTELNGIALYHSNNALISGNTIKVEASPGVTSAGIKIFPVAALSNITIQSNNIYYSAYGIRCADASTLKNLIITGNTIYSKENYAIEIPTNDYSQVTISGNVLSSVVRGGVRMAAVVNATISSNIITAAPTSYAGIYLYMNCRNVNIFGNTIYAPYGAIYVEGKAGNENSMISISANTVTGANGIRCTYSHNVTISGNCIDVLASGRAVNLDSYATMVKVIGNTYTGSYASTVYDASTNKRIVIDGVGKNGANDPASAGEWSGFGYDGLFVKWNNGATHYLSVYRGGAWYDWVVA